MEFQDRVLHCVDCGAEFTWTARAEDWQWGPWRDTCVVGGRTLEYHVSCR